MTRSMNALVAAPHTENLVQSSEFSLDLVRKQVKCNRQSDQKSESDGNYDERLPAANRTSRFMAKLNEACNFKSENIPPSLTNVCSLQREDRRSSENSQFPRSSRMKCNGATHNYIWREEEIFAVVAQQYRVNPMVVALGWVGFDFSLFCSGSWELG